MSGLGAERLRPPYISKVEDSRRLAEDWLSKARGCALTKLTPSPFQVWRLQFTNNRQAPLVQA